MDNRILVVDDEEVIRDLFEEGFSQAGYSVSVAASAEEALEILSRDEIKVMFLDLKLPGTNGIDLCRQIKRDRPSFKVYAVTGYAPLLDLEDCRKAGFRGYFTKPVNLKRLFKAAEDALSEIERETTG